MICQWTDKVLRRVAKSHTLGRYYRLLVRSNVEQRRIIAYCRVCTCKTKTKTKTQRADDAFQEKEKNVENIKIGFLSIVAHREYQNSMNLILNSLHVPRIYTWYWPNRVGQITKYPSIFIIRVSSYFIIVHQISNNKQSREWLSSFYHRKDE